MSTNGTGSKIPPAVVAELFDLSQSLHPATKRVWNDSQLAEHLRARHGIEVAHDAVTRALRPLRNAAREAMMERVRARMTERLDTQLETFDDLLDKVAADARRAKGGKSRADSTDVFRKGLQVKLRYTIGERVEVDADVTSAGAALTFYVPAKRDDDARDGDGDPDD